jgi:hypothetical protein
LGTPGARQSGAAFASVETLGFIKIAAVTVETDKATNQNRRIA